MDAVTPAVVYTPLLNVAAPERCRQGVYTPVLNAVIPAETREQVKLMGNSLIAILIHPEVADQMEEHLQRLVTAIEATGKSLAFLPPPAPPVVETAPEPEAPAKPTKKEKVEKGPHSEFWRNLMASGFCNIPAMRAHINQNRTADTVPDKDFLYATFGVASLSNYSPDELRGWIQFQFPASGVNALMPLVDQAEGKAQKEATA